MRQSISYHLQKTWDIQSPLLYRYLAKEFTDAFFNDGILRLSSFNNFSQHSDEQRNDSLEGYGKIIFKTPDGEEYPFEVRSPLNSYIFCTSTLYCEAIAEDFKTNSGFRINNIIGFVEAVSKNIPYFSGGTEGGCIYLPSKTIEVEVPNDFFNDMSSSNSDEIVNKANDIISDVSDLYFIKSNSYRSQCEYRLAWHSSSETDSYIDIKCPEAIQFCTRFEDLRVEKEDFSEYKIRSGFYLRSGSGGPSISKMAFKAPNLKRK